MSTSSAASKSLLRDALSATTAKDKGPPVADGILSITPDTPEVVEWRRSALDITETTSTYLDDDDDVGPKPHELYGKFTWKIENFSETSKRELRSNVFDVGNYKWYILVYPQGCDVCNHLSLFLCVADYDKLLPGWSHFAQFTIAVVNKDPKKSKYSDTLHRFCKKEHDWGWKKFMELSKVLDGFTVADTLVIKAQVQVILEKPSTPFRCLDPQYRRELVRVYLTNVEGVCRRFCDDKKQRLLWVKDEVQKFRDFWVGLSTEQQRKLLAEKADGILKGLVKQFFNEKEVTSTLVMDALYSGCKQVEEHSRLYMEGKSPDGPPLVLIKAERNAFALVGDLLDLADKVCKDFIPMAKDDKPIQPNDGLALRSGQEDDYRRDSIERDEKRLAELGRKTVEMYVISQIITEKMEVSYRDAEALKRQDQLIAEEFEMQQIEESKAKVLAEKEKEKKAKKKEKVKAKKEADKAKKDAEDLERKKLDDAKRLEAERKAQEAAAAERKRQEEEQQVKNRQQAAAAARQQVQQQQASSKANKTSPLTASAAPAPPPPPPPRSSMPSSAKGSASASAQHTSGSGKQQQQASPKASHRQTSSSLSASVPDPSSDLPSSSDASAEELHHLRDAESAAASEDTDDCNSTKGVGTVDQATGRSHDSDEEEDDDEFLEAEGDGEGSPSAAVAAAVAATSAANARSAELEREVSSLRSRVRSLEKQLAERDAEVFALQAQLAELQPSELADLVGRRKQHASSLDSSSRPSEKDVAQAGKAEAAGLANGKDVPAYSLGSAPPPPPPPPPLPAAQSTLQIAATAGRRPGGNVPPYDPAGVQARAAAAAAAAHHHQQQASGPSANLRPAQSTAQAPASAGSDSLQQLGRTGSSGFPLGGGAAGAPSAPSANGGRPRQDSNTAINTAQKLVGAAMAQQQQKQFGNGAATSSGTALAAGGPSGHNGAAGILHSSYGESSTPSYRNAAVAGTAVAAGSAAGTLHVSNASSSSLQQQQQQARGGTGMPLPVGGGGLGTPAKKPSSLDEPLTPTGPNALQQQQQQARASSTHLNHAVPEFASARLMMQQAQQQQQSQQGNLSYGAVAGKRPQQPVTPQMDSPGLDDFAHMGLIDDLLTE